MNALLRALILITTLKFKRFTLYILKSPDPLTFTRKSHTWGFPQIVLGLSNFEIESTGYLVCIELTNDIFPPNLEPAHDASLKKANDGEGQTARFPKRKAP